MRILTIDAPNQLTHSLAQRSGIELMSLVSRRKIKNLVPHEGCPWAFDYPAGAKISWRAIKLLRQTIKKFQPDVIQSLQSRGLAHSVLATTGLPNPPKIVAFRGITKNLSRLDPANWITYLSPKIEAYACESDAIRQALIQSGVDNSRCWITYNGVLPATEKSQPSSSLLQSVDVPSDAFVVGTMAYMRRIKGIDILLKAAISCHDLHDIYWVLFGGIADPLVKKLAQDPRIRDRVRLMGHVPQAREMISMADLFVMPSRSEGLCRALLEAMNVGVCPIVSDAGGMKEVVRHRRDGIVFPRESVEHLTSAIRMLHEDRQLTSIYAASAKRRIAESFSGEKMADRLIEGYQRLLGLDNSPSGSLTAA